MGQIGPVLGFLGRGNARKTGVRRWDGVPWRFLGRLRAPGHDAEVRAAFALLFRGDVVQPLEGDGDEPGAEFLTGFLALGHEFEDEGVEGWPRCDCEELGNDSGVWRVRSLARSKGFELCGVAVDPAGGGLECGGFEVLRPG